VPYRQVLPILKKVVDADKNKDRYIIYTLDRDLTPQGANNN